jgi:ATP-dependent protease HslVU (ClpYQ) peptidase subunit
MPEVIFAYPGKMVRITSPEPSRPVAGTFATALWGGRPRMTVIVGLVQDGGVYIGGDSAGISGLSLTVRADTKVFHNGPYLFGFTGSFRMGQLIHHALTPPQPTRPLERFMSTTFIDSLRTCLKEGGWARRDSDREEGGTFLVGVSGRLFTVESDYQVGYTRDGYAAVGAGDEIALGSLYATASTGMPPRQRVQLALRAAEHFSAGVRAPFVVLQQKPG